MNKAKKSDRIKWFDSLRLRDFENGAVRDEIRTALGQLDEAERLLKYYHDEMQSEQLKSGSLENKLEGAKLVIESRDKEVFELKARIKELEDDVKFWRKKYHEVCQSCQMEDE